MVNIIENWTEIKGKVILIEPNLSSNELIRITLKVEKFTPVEKFPNLIQLNTNNEITVNLKKSEMQKIGLKNGDEITGLVRAAILNNYFFKNESIQIA